MCIACGKGNATEMQPNMMDSIPLDPVAEERWKEQLDKLLNEMEKNGKGKTDIYEQGQQA